MEGEVWEIAGGVYKNLYSEREALWQRKQRQSNGQAPHYWDLKAFPDAARSEAGHQLWRVQRGDLPEDFKYIGEVGGGVYEIRIHKQGEHRIFYVAKFPEAVYVLHAFEKRSRKTDRQDIEIGRRRYAQLLATRKA